MKDNFRVSFFLRGKEVNREGKSPIDIRLYLRGQRIRLCASGLYVDAAQWDSVKSRSKARTGEASELNNELRRIETDLMQIYRMNEFSEGLSLDKIKAIYLGKEPKEQMTSFLQFYEEFLERVESEVGKQRSYDSFQKFSVIKKHFVAFLKTRYRRKDIQMSELTYRVICDFENYLLNEGKCQHNTVMRMIGSFKTVTIRARKYGLLPVDPFADYKIHFYKTDRGFLDEDEIKTLMEKKFEIKRMEVVRDIFIFSCFTGLAYIDITQLTKDNIREIDGRPWIMTSRQKTNVPSNILLLDVAQQIIKKYDGVAPKGQLLPILTNQRMNSYLREIGDVCGIGKKLTFHLARHTFATLAITKGVPIESVSKMLGHTKISTTQIYARIINKKVEHDMLELESKLSSFNVDSIVNSKKNAAKAKPSRYDEVEQDDKNSSPLRQTRLSPASHKKGKVKTNNAKTDSKVKTGQPQSDKPKTDNDKTVKSKIGKAKTGNAKSDKAKTNKTKTDMPKTGKAKSSKSTKRA